MRNNIIARYQASAQKTGANDTLLAMWEVWVSKLEGSIQKGLPDVYTLDPDDSLLGPRMGKYRNFVTVKEKVAPPGTDMMVAEITIKLEGDFLLTNLSYDNGNARLKYDVRQSAQAIGAEIAKLITNNTQSVLEEIAAARKRPKK